MIAAALLLDMSDGDNLTNAGDAVTEGTDYQTMAEKLVDMHANELASGYVNGLLNQSLPNTDL